MEKLNENGLKITLMLKSQQDKLVQVLVSKIHCRRYRLADASDQLKMKRSKNYKIRISNTKEFKIAQDGVTAVNKENDFVDELDKQQLKAIYSEKLKHGKMLIVSGQIKNKCCITKLKSWYL